MIAFLLGIAFSGFALACYVVTRPSQNVAKDAAWVRTLLGIR